MALHSVRIFFFHRLLPSPLCGSKRLNWAATQRGWVRNFLVCIVYFAHFPLYFGLRITVAILDVSIHFFTFFFVFCLLRTPRVRGNNSHRQLIPPTMSCIENFLFLLFGLRSSDSSLVYPRQKPMSGSTSVLGQLYLLFWPLLWPGLKKHKSQRKPQ